VVLTTGYNPTHLLAWHHARRHGLPHVAMTDGTLASEAQLGPLHRAVRRHVLARSAAAVVASDGGAQLMAHYGVPVDRVFRSVLCAHAGVDWHASGPAVRDIDLLFAGRLVAAKSPGFAVDVAAGVAQRLGRRVRLAVLGSGPLADDVRQQAARHQAAVDSVLAGHVAQGDLPGWYRRARVFLFPTRWDPWGVVANEACESGVPVLVSPHAGVAGELVRDGEGGRVLPLDLPAWVGAAAELLQDETLHARMAAAARRAVQTFNADAAAVGIVQAALRAADRTD
jgi:glycosyltransferase involved in cell wall biosynthesis